ncbi:MAG: hypothetical protein JXB24_12660 [Bacteroidales bacterium]|nr:hypothetical protein [Bacteroidales bacterium]
MPEEYGQTTSSPYSMFAQGQIENLGAGTNRALGGTGLAFKSHRYLNNMNPASYSGIDSLSFVFEAGVTGRYTRYITNNQKQTKYNANLNHIALGFRICRWWATSIGVTPYSSVGYKINTTDMVEGDLSYYLKTYEGSGGINKFYFGNSFRPYKNLSVGVHVSYILGTITQTETGSTIDQYITYIIKEVSRINSYYIDYGAQYTIKHNGWNYSLGAVFGNNKELHVSNEMYIMYSDDSLKLTPEKHKFIIPLKYGFGLALEKMEKLKVGIDYEKRNWSANNRFSNPLLKTRDSERFSAGIEYCPYKSRRDQGFKKVYYRLGVNYNKTYLIIRNEAINSMAISFGFGIPIKREHSMINLAFEFGSLGTTSNELIKENYALMYINFTMLDIWFQKSRFN